MPETEPKVKKAAVESAKAVLAAAVRSMPAPARKAGRKRRPTARDRIARTMFVAIRSRVAARDSWMAIARMVTAEVGFRVGAEWLEAKWLEEKERRSEFAAAKKARKAEAARNNRKTKERRNGETQ